MLLLTASWARELDQHPAKQRFEIHGRYWIRTSDPFRVKEVRYHCANRPIRQS